MMIYHFKGGELYMDSYTFAEYLEDNGFIKDCVKVSCKEIEAYWSIEENRYITFCKNNNLDYEDLNLFFK